jgi:hypothetical protein
MNSASKLELTLLGIHKIGLRGSEETRHELVQLGLTQGLQQPHPGKCHSSHFSILIPEGNWLTWSCSV